MWLKGSYFEKVNLTIFFLHTFKSTVVLIIIHMLYHRLFFISVLVISPSRSSQDTSFYRTFDNSPNYVFSHVLILLSLLFSMLFISRWVNVTSPKLQCLRINWPLLPFSPRGITPLQIRYLSYDIIHWFKLVSPLQSCELLYSENRMVSLLNSGPIDACGLQIAGRKRTITSKGKVQKDWTWTNVKPDS